MKIDRSKDEHKHFPPGVDGEVLLEETADGGLITVDPAHLKWIAENATPEEIEVMGYSGYLDKLNLIKDDPTVVAQKLVGLQ